MSDDADTPGMGTAQDRLITKLAGKTFVVVPPYTRVVGGRIQKVEGYSYWVDTGDLNWATAAQTATPETAERDLHERRWSPAQYEAYMHEWRVGAKRYSSVGAGFEDTPKDPEVRKYAKLLKDIDRMNEPTSRTFTDVTPHTRIEGGKAGRVADSRSPLIVDFPGMDHFPNDAQVKVRGDQFVIADSMGGLYRREDGNPLGPFYTFGTRTAAERFLAEHQSTSDSLSPRFPELPGRAEVSIETAENELRSYLHNNPNLDEHEAGRVGDALDLMTQAREVLKRSDEDDYDPDPPPTGFRTAT